MFAWKGSPEPLHPEGKLRLGSLRRGSLSTRETKPPQARTEGRFPGAPVPSLGWAATQRQAGQWETAEWKGGLQVCPHGGWGAGDPEVGRGSAWLSLVGPERAAGTEIGAAVRYWPGLA